MHNAYRGIDFLRALRVLLFHRRAACVVGHVESLAVILLLRRLFWFTPKVVVWEVPWSSGWRFRDAITGIAVPRADLNVVFGSNQVDLIRTRLSQTAPVAVIPFCVDVGFFSPSSKRAADDGYVFSVGRDCGRDFQIVIDAMRPLGVPVVLRTSMPVVISQCNAGRVTVLSKDVSWPDYLELYERAAVVVIAASETMNASGVTSLLEAMAMGKAVVVTRTAALADYLPPPDAGVVVPSGDAEAMGVAVKALLADAEGRERMGRRARLFALEHYSPPVHFRAIGKLLSNLLNGGERAPPHASSRAESVHSGSYPHAVK